MKPALAKYFPFLLLLLVIGLTACDSRFPFDTKSDKGTSSNQAPEFISGAGISIPENTLCINVSARDADGDAITYRIFDGSDADRFEIAPDTGKLCFKQAPDYDAPADHNFNNTYIVTVEASDGELTAWLNMSVSILDTGLKVATTPDNPKTLRFSWPVIQGVTHYKLYVNPDGQSGFTQVGKNITTTQVDVTIPVHLTDWLNASYKLEGYHQLDLAYQSDPVTISEFMLDSIGYFKASNTEAGDWFGKSVALSGDGNTLAVGAWGESSAATGIDSEQADNSAGFAGAVYVFSRQSGVWVQQAYVKASNTDASDAFGSFGESLALSADGNTLAVGAWGESSAARGIDGNQDDNSAPGAGAVYVFSRTEGSWAQHAYIKASNAGAGDSFGESVSLSADGNTLAVSAAGESSAATGVNGDQDDNTADSAGAVYLFERAAGRWAQQAYLKASNTEALDGFGASVALSADGHSLAVGASGESSAATGIDAEQHDNSADSAGAVYLFSQLDGVWSQRTYVKANNTEAWDVFGESVALSADGNTLAVGASGESSAATGVNGDQDDNTAFSAGAVYLFQRNNGLWSQQAYVKASNAEGSDWFGQSLALSSDGNILAVGAWGESGSTSGINGDQADNDAIISGAVYVFHRQSGIWTQRSYVKASNAEKGIEFADDAFGAFGESISLAADGNSLAVGAWGESSAATGVDGDQNNNTAGFAGAVYLY